MAHHDYTYLDMVSAVLTKEHQLKPNRTSKQTIGITSYLASYPMAGRYADNGDLYLHKFPLLTTKKMNFKAILAEMIWLLNGQTNIRFLEQNGVHIWIDWPLKNYNTQNPDKQLTRSEFSKLIVDDYEFAAMWGDLGPVYGKQWRNWSTHNGSVDQVEKSLDMLINTPTSRRNIISAWNVSDIGEMELPPCHTLFQFLTTPTKDNYMVDLSLYQRSIERLH